MWMLEDMIEEAIVKLFLPMPVHSRTLLKHLHADSYENNMCFQLFAVDFMIDSKLNPLLLDVHDMPSLITTDAIDTAMFREIVMGCVNLLCLLPWPAIIFPLSYFGNLRRGFPFSCSSSPFSAHPVRSISSKVATPSPF